MNPSFNLIYESWIPCLDFKGQPKTLSLLDALIQAHELRSIESSSPLEVAAIYRLLLALLHRVLDGPRTRSDWYKSWQAGRWQEETLQGYLKTWETRFDLYDPQHPFYQKEDKRVKPKSVINIVFDMASGNNATLFDHHIEEEKTYLTSAEAARAVVTLQAFGLGGLSGLEQKFTDSTCTRGVIFMLEGDTLFETILLNLLKYDEENPGDGVYRSPKDQPAWEMDDPYKPERQTPLGYIDYLTWQSRRVLLFPELYAGGVRVGKMTLAPGLRLDGNVLDPMKHYKKSDTAVTGYALTRFSEDKSLWRDSSALLNIRNKQDGQHPPKAFLCTANLIEDGYLDYHHRYRNLALGMANDKTKVEFFRVERMPLPLEYLKDEFCVAALDTALQTTEQVWKQLWGTCHSMAKNILAPDKNRQPDPKTVSALLGHWDINHIFWSSLEIPFYSLIENIPQDSEGAVLGWNRTLRQAAWDSVEYLERCAGDKPETLAALVKGRRQLAAGLNKVLSAPNKQGD
ncbi:MAG: type I-E CRISPR-associated protein Cse1/CasA [Chloroflexota bacterium]